jgi:Na+-transporting methylmalonyl-CoA/oxaloacetate decarboxylase gamma subunit
MSHLAFGITLLVVGLGGTLVTLALLALLLRLLTLLFPAERDEVVKKGPDHA